ncbi:MAG: prolipoprotein diacylglyceryl transferase [Oscillospiraceae bacterium]|jgi:phosphatidylglycerol:prolipoprotein diacylglycerol transferase|nr:prolipoprotein diacylglyceryl transferase [Oscillospiraceae bacterium]
MDPFIHLPSADTAAKLVFPGLGLDFSISRVAIFIGPFTIYWYGIIVVTGIALGVIYATWRAAQFGVDKEKLSDVFLYAIIAGMLGARAYYVAFSWDYYKLHPEEIVQIWKGGIAFYGGVLAAILCGYLLCRRWKLPVVRALDAALGGLLLGQSIGRWGNFVNIEAFGGYFDGPWRMVSPVIDSYFHMHPDLLPGFTADQVLQMRDIPVHPTFFYESAWTMLGFLFIVWYTKHRKFNGELTLLYFFINGIGRAVIEGLRTDSLTAGSIRVSQVLAGCMVALAALLWFAARKKLADGTAPVWMLLAVPVTADVTKEGYNTQTDKTEQLQPEDIIPEDKNPGGTDKTGHGQD